MKYPKLRVIGNSRQIVDEFKGYNHNLRIGSGEFYDMKNMTSDYYPVLSPRGKRGVYAKDGQYYGMIAKDGLCYVKGIQFFMNENPVDGLVLTESPKQLISMGAYVIIMPDKIWINTKDLTYGNIEAFYTAQSARYAMCKADSTEYGDIYQSSTPPDPEKYTLWIDTSTTPHALKQYSTTSAVWNQIATTYVRISAQNIAENFSQYDAVEISGLPPQLADMNDTTVVLWDAYHDPGDEQLGRKEGTDDYIVIVGILDEVMNRDAALRIKRTMPEMDFIIEANNRLWGCRYGPAANGEIVNEIYCSKLGDFKNWNCFMEISTDSWVGSCGTDGQWTGAITHMGYPMFFKENYLHKVYGNIPSNFQVQTTPCKGVQKGCEKSLAIVNTTLFYKGRSGVCAYDGSLPVEISYALGNVAYSSAVGGSVGNKYYVRMDKAGNGDFNLFVFDVAKSMWHKEEDDSLIESFCSCDGELYAIEGNKIITMLGSGTPDESPVEWMAETGEIGISSPDSKYVSRLTLRMSMEFGSEVVIYASYDFNGSWEQVCVLTGDSLRTFSIPIRPKRCDYMKLRIEGVGAVKIYSITKTIEQGSELS